MITLIGTYNSVIGFGLCGVKKVREVTDNTSAKDIMKIIGEVDSQIILIDSHTYAKVEDMVKDSEKVFVRIPDRWSEDVNMDQIDELVKDTIGISMKVTE